MPTETRRQFLGRAGLLTLSAVGLGLSARRGGAQEIEAITVLTLSDFVYFIACEKYARPEEVELCSSPAMATKGLPSTRSWV